MPSIRRSLIVYFLVLLALALSGIALLADRVTGSALSDKESATTALIDQNADEREREERNRFDAELLSQAKVVARTAVGDYAVQIEQVKTRSDVVIPITLFGTATAPTPLSPLAAAFNIQAIHSPVPTRRGWTGGPMWGILLQAVVQANAGELDYPAFLTRHLDGLPDAPLIQIDSARGVWASTRVPDDGLPFDPENWEAYGDEWRFDTLHLDGGPVRRVIFKSAAVGITRWGWGGWGGRSRERDPRGGRGGAAPPRPGPPAVPVNFYQVARPTTELDATVATIRFDAEQGKEALRTSTAATRRTVRLLLVLGSGVAFVGLLIGGWILVSVGLWPLRKLTDAVSRVSEKDFYLPVRASELSHELVPIHDRLAQALEQLKAAFEREKQAVADISHELRTPVAGLLATIDVTLRKPRTAEQYKQALDDCRVITKQLGGLVERVMTLAYLDAGHTEVQSTPADVTELATGCAAVIRPLAEAQGLTLTADLHPTGPVVTDPDKLREVMINLLHNAVEYNRPGGNIHLRALRDEDDRVVVEVSDTGIGMSDEVRGKIFERFYRADPSRTATGVHAGLGLAIVKEYIDRLGGAIEVESEPDRGSTFRVILPPSDTPA